MPNCVVKLCKNKTNYNKKSEGITYHKIPHDPVKKRKWTDALIKLGRDNNWYPSNRTVVCSDHFDKDQFTTTRNGKRVILKPNALPIYKVADKSNEPNEDHTMDTVNTEENVQTKTGRKRTLLLHTKSERETIMKSRLDIDDIIIDYDNIDKFGEQIAFLLKRIPRQLCRKLQDSIVTLVKTETKRYENESKRDAIPSTSSSTKVVDILSQIVLTPTLVTKPNTTEKNTIKEEHEEEESPDNESTQVNQLKAHTSTKPFISRIITFPKPMTVPIELVGSLDCVKQEVLDPGYEQYNEDSTSETVLADTLKIKMEVEETDSGEEANLNNNS